MTSNAVPPKLKGRKKNRTEVKPFSGLNVEELLQSDSGKKSNQISPQNAIPGFRQMLDAVEDISGIRDAVTQLGSIIETQIKDSFGDINYGRAIEELDVMRSEMIEIEEPAIYNDFVRTLKTKLLKGELSGDRRDMWYELKKAELGLIDSKQSESSTVTKEEAKQVSIFWSDSKYPRFLRLILILLVSILKAMTKRHRSQSATNYRGCPPLQYADHISRYFLVTSETEKSWIFLPFFRSL